MAAPRKIKKVGFVVDIGLSDESEKIPKRGSSKGSSGNEENSHLNTLN